jgi:CBS-domain-containing membrane protein
MLLDQDISGAPVVDDEGNLVGILSESDLIWKVGPPCPQHLCGGCPWPPLLY